MPDRALADLAEARSAIPLLGGLFRSRAFIATNSSLTRRSPISSAPSNMPRSVRTPISSRSRAALWKCVKTTPALSRSTIRRSRCGQIFWFTFSTRGALLLQTAQIERAMAGFNRAVALNPSSPRGVLRARQHLRRMGDLDHAISDYSRAISLSPSQWSYYAARGDALQRKGDLDRAIAESTTSCCRSFPTTRLRRSASGRHGGKSRDRHGDCRPAGRSSFAAAPGRRPAPRPRAIRRLPPWSAKPRVSASAPARRPPIAARQQGDHARRQIGRGSRGARARTHLEEGTVLGGACRPRRGARPQGQLGAAQCPRRGLARDQAIRPCHGRLRSRPGDQSEECRCAHQPRHRHALARPNEPAMAEFNRALAINPKQPTAYRRGNVLLRQGQIDKALVEFDRALAINRDRPMCWRIAALRSCSKGGRRKARWTSTAPWSSAPIWRRYLSGAGSRSWPPAEPERAVAAFC